MVPRVKMGYDCEVGPRVGQAVPAVRRPAHRDAAEVRRRLRHPDRRASHGEAEGEEVKRRRLILLVALLFLTCGFTVWWLGHLTDEERPFVGTWWWPAKTRFAFTFTADHQVHFPAGAFDGAFGPTEVTGGWWAEDGKVYFDFEPSGFRRALRPLLTRLGVKLGAVWERDRLDFDVDGINARPLFVRAGPAG